MARQREEGVQQVQGDGLKRFSHSTVQELCEGRGGHPGLPVPTAEQSFTVVSVHVKQH